MTSPADGGIGRVALEPCPDAPSKARHHTRSALRVWGLTGEVAETAELVVSELVTNSVQHAARCLPATGPSVPLAGGPRTDEIVLTLRQSDGVLRIEVADWDATPPRLGDVEAAAVSDLGEGGRGLVIVAAVAKQWGCLHPTDGGKAVWCELTAN